MIYPLANLLGEWNWIIIVLAGLLLFGKRLPEVGRSLGKGIVEFKKGLQGIEEEIELATTAKPHTTNANTTVARLPDSAAGGYKFDPYTGQPINIAPPAQPAMRFDPYTGKPISSEPATSGQSSANIGA